MTSAELTPAMTARSEAVERALDRAAGARPVPGNRVTLMQDGPAVFEVMLRLIADARDWVHFENYIIRDDATGQRFAAALAERAKAGVRVRVLYDWLGSHLDFSPVLARAARSGCGGTLLQSAAPVQTDRQPLT